MRIETIALSVCAVCFTTACGSDEAGLTGDPCVFETDCATGFTCVPLEESASGCTGSVCVARCQVNEDCPDDFYGRDCEDIDDGRRSVCLCGAFEDQFCQ